MKAFLRELGMVLLPFGILYALGWIVGSIVYYITHAIYVPAP